MCPEQFPSFDKSCIDADDCAAVIHTTDCCGNSIAIGINVAEVANFDAAELICDAQYPACGCPAGPTIAEDGNPILDPNDIFVSCANNGCMTSVP
jgi:hypothetical protein